MLFFVLFSLVLSMANAVSIMFFPNDLGVCNSTVSMSCTNFAEGLSQCCVAPAQTLSALFTGLPLPAAQGVIYRGGSCGTSCNAGSGLNLCLTCQPAAYITGANWFRPMSKRDETSPCTPIQPDIMTINGRQFNIGANSNVQESDMAEFARLFSTPFSEDSNIPAQLLRYENTTYTA